jgi:hypothetical protein
MRGSRLTSPFFQEDDRRQRSIEIATAQQIHDCARKTESPALAVPQSMCLKFLIRDLRREQFTGGDVCLLLASSMEEPLPMVL